MTPRLPVRIWAILAVFSAWAPGIPAPGEAATREGDLLTVAERSGFHATSRNEDVLSLSRRLARRFEAVELLELGRTAENRIIPLLVLATPPIRTPAEARASRKPVILALGNIHAGEVCGKEALLMLARELAASEDGNSKRILERWIIALVPNLNPDGNARIARGNRPTQKGPAEGTGERTNAGGLDLNRDFVKLEAPETRALARFTRHWDPVLTIDTHTTNGSFHRYPITYAGPKNPAGDRRVIEYMRDDFLPTLGERLRDSQELETFFYGNFRADHARWETYPDFPRYGAPYRGLRGRPAILCEAYAYDSFEDRVANTLRFLRSTLELANDRREEMQRLVATVDRETAGLARKPENRGRIALRSRVVPLATRARILGYIEETRDGKTVPTGEPAIYDVELLNRFEPTLEVDRPFAYLVDSSLSAVIENLQHHGIRVEELREDLELDLEIYTVESVARTPEAFQGHRLARAQVTKDEVSRLVRAGAMVVPMTQPLANLAAYLLEPQSEDGLLAWNFFDGRLEARAEFPVLRVRSPVPLLTTPARALPGERPPARAPSPELVYESEEPLDLDGSVLRGLRWLHDGGHYLHSRDGRLRRVHAESGRIEPFHDVEAMARGLAALPGLDDTAARGLAGQTYFRLDRAEETALFLHENDLYVCRLDGQHARRLTSSPEEEEIFSFSPDGEWVAFVRDNDLWVVDVQTGTGRQLTTGGHDRLRRGKASWVYYEEVLDRHWKTYWWSPDSRRLAFLEIDSGPVREFIITNDLEEPQVVETTPYPRPGAPNPRVRLAAVTVAGGEPRWADLSAYDLDSLLITGVGWWPDGEDLYFYAQDRAQTWLDFCRLSTFSERPVRLFRETTEAWVNPPDPPLFLDDGSFLLTSERSGWKHIYHFTRTGHLRNQVTSGPWEVRTLLHLDEATGWLWFTGTKDSPVAHNLYRTRLDGSELERLTRAPGHHRVNLDPTATYFVDTWSSHSTPPKVALRRTDGSEVRTLDTNPVHELEAVRLSTVELFQIYTNDGFPLEALLVRPPDFSPSRRYPVWFSTYAGPHAQTVWDAWHGGRVWDQLLASKGFLVFHCDPRSASGKGAVSAWTAYRQLGVQELADIEEAIAWLTSHPWVDATRIGISGYSYGGFMTTYAMTHSKLFAAGIAGAPVTDWRDYDSIYTERYMNTPQENAKGYQRTSAREAAGDLHGRLLVIHGGMDDNVHAKNTLRLARELQRASKTFEMMIYPESRHGVWGKHFQRLQYDFILRTLARE